MGKRKMRLQAQKTIYRKKWYKNALFQINAQ